MGKMLIWGKIKQWIGGVGFQLFLWSNGQTTNEYIKEINQQYEREKSLGKRDEIVKIIKNHEVSFLWHEFKAVKSTAYEAIATEIRKLFKEDL